MNICERIEDVRAQRWADPTLSWGLVPTMGYLHEGHLSLIRRARADNKRLGVSIYVNPAQFAPHEDLNRYPRNLEHDLGLLEREGVDLVFIPTNQEMYPDGFQTKVTVSEVTRPLEGASRPTHFQGVTTVVAKLFNIFEPHRAYFGQKDAQQVVVIRQMVNDLAFNVAIVVCPIVREPDGLAMSSRNARLNEAQRQAATVLYRALSAARDAYQSGEWQADSLRRMMQAIVQAEPLARLDYVSVAHPSSLRELDVVEDDVLLSMAVFVGDVRLIDNMPLSNRDL